MTDNCNKSCNILIIVPCYNEEKNIEQTVANIKKYGYDYIVINDGSKDHTEDILCQNQIKHISLSNNLGIGGGMQAGYKYAKQNRYDIAVQFDGDGQHNSYEIDKIIAPILQGEADLVIGSRYLNSEGFKSTFLRRCGISFLSWMMKIMLGKRIKDMTSGFRAVKYNLIELFAYDYPYEYPEPVTNFKAQMDGYRIKEIPVVMNERKHGISSITALKSIYYMINVFFQFIILKFTGKKKGDEV